MKQSSINNLPVFFLGEIALPPFGLSPQEEDRIAAQTCLECDCEQKLYPTSFVRGRLYKPHNLPVARLVGEVHINRELVYKLRHHETHFFVFREDLFLASQKEVDNYLNQE